VKLLRSSITDALLGDKNAFHLLIVIALRARWSSEPSLDRLTYGQAQIGDCETIDLTPKEYRCAKDRLAKWRLATFTGSRAGTIATLLDNRVFSLSDERNDANMGQPNGQHEGERIYEVISKNGASNGASIAANEGRTRGQQGATNKKVRKEELLVLCGEEGANGADPKPGLKIKKPRERDELLDSLAAVDGSNPSQVTGKAWGAIAQALKEIREVCPTLTQEEITRRAENYRRHMPDVTISANALAKHWAKCDRPPNRNPFIGSIHRDAPLKMANLNNSDATVVGRET